MNMSVKPLSKRDRLHRTANDRTGTNENLCNAERVNTQGSPVILKVEGLVMDNASFVPDQEEDKVAMGNVMSQDEPENPEQLDPLTKPSQEPAQPISDSNKSGAYGKPEKQYENDSGGGVEQRNNDRNTLLNADDRDTDNTGTDIVTDEDTCNEKDANKNNVKENGEEEGAEDGASSCGNVNNVFTVGKPADTTNGTNRAASNEDKKEDGIEVLVAGKDDVDAASTYSLFMERDFRYYFQHPYCRLFVAYFVVFCNFLIYAEDPVAHSRKECLIPMIGNDIAFVMTRYPPNAWSLLKVIFWLLGLLIGMLIGKLIIHGLLFNKIFRLKMFSDDQGSWMIMFLISLICVFIMSCFYNLFLMIGGESTEAYRISDLMGVSNDIFMKVAACGTWCGDFFTAWMVTDIMLQEKLYPGWARPVRNWWKKGYHRIILFWIVVVVTSFVVIFVIATDYINWDKLNRDFLPTNELSRAILASFILVMDLLIVMQDWDFPHFMSAIDIKLPGMNTAHIRFEIPSFVKRWENLKVHITGKWFNYGVLFLVMLLDLNMWKNQIFYTPYDYGQYASPEERIYTVQDHYSLENHNKSQISYEFRSTSIDNSTGQPYINGDTHMNTKYMGFSLGLKAIAFFPCIIAFIVFGVLIWQFGRFKPTEHDPYAGRLKKRLKKRLSFRLPWRRRAKVERKIHAVPKLLYFKQKKGEKAGEGEEVVKELPSEGFSSDHEEKSEIPTVTAVTET